MNTTINIYKKTDLEIQSENISIQMQTYAKIINGFI